MQNKLLLLLLLAAPAVSLDASPALPLVPMFPNPNPNGFANPFALFSGMYKLMDGAATKLATTTTGTWTQQDSPTQIVFVGQLPDDFGAQSVDVKPDGKEITVSVSKHTNQRTEADKQPSVTETDSSIVRTFILPFVVNTQGVHTQVDSSGQQVTVTVDVPAGVTISPREPHAPLSAGTAYAYHSPSGFDMSLKTSNPQPLVAPLLSLGSMLANSFMNFPQVPNSVANPGQVEYAHNPARQHMLVRGANNDDKTTETNTKEDETLLPTMPKISQPSFPAQPFRPMFPFFGFGGNMFPTNDRLMHALESKQDSLLLGTWTHSVNDKNLVFVGQLPQDTDLSKIRVTAKGNKLVVEEMSHSTAKRHKKTDTTVLEEGEMSQAQKKVFVLPFDVTSDKLDKTTDNTAKRITVTLPVPDSVPLSSVDDAIAESSSNSYRSSSSSSSGYSSSSSSSSSSSGAFSYSSSSSSHFAFGGGFGGHQPFAGF